LRVWEQTVDTPAFHERAANEACELEEAVGRLDCGMDQLEQKAMNPATLLR